MIYFHSLYKAVGDRVKFKISRHKARDKCKTKRQPFKTKASNEKDLFMHTEDSSSVNFFKPHMNNTDENHIMSELEEIA